MNSLNFVENLIEKTLIKKKYISKIGILFKRFIKLFIHSKPSLIMGFVSIFLSKQKFFSNIKFISVMDYYLENFLFQNFLLIKNIQLDVSLKKLLFSKISKKSVYFSNRSKKKSLVSNKNLFLLWKIKDSMIRFNSLPIVIKKNKKNKKTIDFAKRKLLQREAALDRKLILIRETAIRRKFKRLGLDDQFSLWNLLVEPLLQRFKNEKIQDFSLGNFKNRVLRTFLEKMSYHIYNTLSKLSKDQVLKLIEELKKESSRRSLIANKKSNKEGNWILEHSKWLKIKLDFVNEQWFFSLNHLQKSIEFILGARINLFFVNDLSFLKFRSRLINRKSFDSTRFYGLKFLSQKLRLEKINSNRQYQKLLKEPFLIERRGKRRGPFLRDFVLLVLIGLVSRNFLPLLRFIDFQMRNLAKTKRQIPFLRFLIRLISNLGGSLIKLKGLRIQFKGRFDRWNRTKSLIFTSGNIPFQRKNKDIEYCSTHGLVKKGVFGIRFWVWYSSNFHQSYYDTFTTYWYFKQ